MARSIHPLVLLSLLGGGCFSEGLNIHNLVGTVTVPRELATRTTIDPVSGDPVTTTDVALIGAVYVGLYAGVDYQVEDFPHPVLGPSNDAFPYGGTTIGDLRYPCVEDLVCKILSGRFTSYDSMIDWYADVVGTPIRDANENEITNGEYFRQTCFELRSFTSDEEIRLLPPDRNEDGVLDAMDLDFVEDDDGNFVASFEILQQDFYPGMTAWAFVDQPSTESFRFDTCNDQIGFTESTYNRRFRVGAQATNVLNRPYQYIKAGDWVTAFPFEWTDSDDEARLVVDFLVGTNQIGDLDLSGSGE